MGSPVKKILNLQQKSDIIRAIESAEKNTSGEIRVHIESKCTNDALQRAVAVFGFLKMHETVGRNGVLIYVAVDSRKIAIVGDINIDKVVSPDFWSGQKTLMINYFSEGRYAEGLIKVINNIGMELKQYFPYDQKGDINELPNDISFGD